MSEPAAPGIAGDAAASGPDSLLKSNSHANADEIEAILADFRDWLRENSGAPSEAAPAAEPVDLYTLVAQFVALRQEVNLQTRAVRQQQEQTAETVRRYGDCVELLEAASQRQGGAALQSDSEQLRPLLNGLIEAADAQMLAAKEMARVVKALSAESVASSPNEVHRAPPQQSFLERLLGIGRLAKAQQDWLADFERRWNDRLAIALQSNDGSRLRAMIEGAAAGLTMGVQRLERTMRQYGLEPIVVDGRTFDPEQMEAIEVVAGSGRTSGEIFEEVRRGYRLNDRVFRFAQVRVAK